MNKKWFDFNFDAAVKQEFSSPFKVPKPKVNRSRKIATPTAKAPITDFFSKLEPRLKSDLAVHTKKILEVETWLQQFVISAPKKNFANFLLITGPTGSGKTATLRVLCRELQIAITEWINPVDHDYETNYGSQSQLGRFQEFLTESRWGSLLDTGQKKLILVEDYPNFIIRNPDDFKTILEDCQYRGGSNFVFICTDTFNSGKSLPLLLFPQELRDKLGITTISFNACASTLLKAALKRAQSIVAAHKDSFNVPSQESLQAIIATANGDIRCALNQFHFASLQDCGDLPTESTVTLTKTTSKRKRNQDSVATIKFMSRDTNLGLFHAVGKVLFPKKIITETSWKFNCDIDRLVEEFSVYPATFVNYLFENYLKYFDDLNDCLEASEILSFSQVFFEKFYERDVCLLSGLWIAVLGMLLSNKKPVAKWNQITGPKKLHSSLRASDLQRRNIPITEVYYYDLINNKTTNSNLL